MYVCSCNALTDRQILSVAREARGSPERAYALLGCEPQCARCLPLVREILARAEAPDGATDETTDAPQDRGADSGRR